MTGYTCTAEGLLYVDGVYVGSIERASVDRFVVRGVRAVDSEGTYRDTSFEAGESHLLKREELSEYDQN